MTSNQQTDVKKSSVTRAGLSYELRQLLTLGLPIMGAQVAAMGIGITDTIMAGRLSAADLAGIALGSNVLWPSLLLFWGVLMAVTPIVSQLRGAGRISETGIVVQQALWLGVFGSVIVILALINADLILNWVQADPVIIAISVPYLKAMAWGIPGVMGYVALRHLVEGMGHTKPPFVIALIALCLNVPLNYIFMYGSFGLPAFGGVGCGISSAIIMWLECLAMVIIVTRAPFRQCACFSSFTWPKFAKLRKILVLGLPIGLTTFLEIAVFSVVGLLLGRLGADVVASHQIAMNAAGIAFMLPLALGSAACIRIGFNVGADRLDQARLTAQISLASALVVGILLGLVIFLVRDGITFLYTKDMAVATLAAKLLLFVAGFQVFDCIQAIAVGALRGYKETKFPLIANLISYWLVALPIGYFLAYGFDGKSEGLGIYGFWICFVLGLALVAVSVACRLIWLTNRPGRVTISAQH